MATRNELTVQEQRELLSNPAYVAQKNFEMQQRMANMYVQSTIVPAAYRGNVGNCVIAIDMAQRMGANPLMVMQNLYIVNGNPAWSAKFLVSCINMSGRFTPIRYQFAGKRGSQQYACRAYAYEKGDTAHKEPLCSIWITMEMAEKEGWTKKPGSKWLTMPDQMLIYRAAAFWARAYAPEISMGFLTKEEAEDISNGDYDVMTVEAVPADDIPEPVEDEPARQAGAANAPAQAAQSAQGTPKEAQPTAQPKTGAETSTAKASQPVDAVGDAIKRQKITSYRAPQGGTLFVDSETGEVK